MVATGTHCALHTSHWRVLQMYGVQQGSSALRTSGVFVH